MVDRKNTFHNGYRNFTDIAGGILGAQHGDSYVSGVEDACKRFQSNINSFAGYETGIEQLKGDIQEFRAAGTFNIKAILNGSAFRANVDRSHNYASPDITTNWGEEYGLKVLYNGKASAKAQAISQFQRFSKYINDSDRRNLTFESFLAEKGLDPKQVLATDPIYSGQARLIPDDQLKEAISYLKKQIANKSITNPNEVQRYQETLDKLTSKIVAPDGTESSAATTQMLRDIARKAKNGEYVASEDGFSVEQLIEIEHALQQGVKSGITAATITLVLKIAPDIYNTLDRLISEGKIDENQLKSLGFAALSGSTEGFVRGFISATIVTSCETGMLGDALKSVNPQAVGAMTVVVMNTLKDAFLMAKGSLSKQEFSYNLQRNLFVTACGLGGGALLGVMTGGLAFAYLLGNFVGSMIGAFAFVDYENAILSYCVSSGSTFFGIVDQNFRLPDTVLRELGVSLFDYEQYFYDEYKYNEYIPSLYKIDTYDANMVRILRRGVIGVRQVGYIK